MNLSRQHRPIRGLALPWAGEGASRSAAAHSQKTFARGNFEHCCGIQKNRKQTFTSFTHVSYVVYLQTAGTQTSKSCLCFPGSHSWHWPVQRTVDWPQRIHRQKHNQHTADQLKTAVVKLPSSTQLQAFPVRVASMWKGNCVEQQTHKITKCLDTVNAADESLLRKQHFGTSG